MTYIITINNDIRQRLGITIGTYCIADCIHKCFKSGALISDIHQITEIAPNWIEASLVTLERMNLVKIAPRSGKITVTPEWREATKSAPKVIAESKIISRIRKECEARNDDFYWDGTQAGQAKELIKRICFSFEKRKSRQPEEDEIFDSFQMIINSLPEFWQNKWDLAKIVGNYSSIVMQIKDSYARKLASEVGVGSTHHAEAIQHFIRSNGDSPDH